MRAFAWIPLGLVVGFLVGFGVPMTADVLPLVAVSFLAVGYFLIANSGIVQG